MSMSLSRTAFMVVWLVAVALFVLSGVPMTFATGVFLLVGLGVAPAILVIWRNNLCPAGTEVVHLSRTQE
jgi:hypothetical protein